MSQRIKAVSQGAAPGGEGDLHCPELPALPLRGGREGTATLLPPGTCVLHVPTAQGPAGSPHSLRAAPT